MNEIISRNRMSATALKESQNSGIDFVKNPKREGKLFFSCGSIQGYISPAVKSAFESGTLTIDDMQYAECSTDGGVSYVPCLMMVGDGRKNIVKSF